ncbi:hypothetical protein SAMN05216238_10341 [Lentibacillus persicus]|uniref:Uncharacterized protein n=1 Tax=Lentibacillus persicus TaxID=640948 RepID=A0A1I1U619_9BACI|nr:hypothetical protein [Lentibacillus persicus]SFD66219.1 hypothetical protein SAMN05216238_10341 [Lentibacillus persicus]
MRLLISRLFPKWDIVHASQNIEDFYKAKTRLYEKGIAYKVSTLTTDNGTNRKNGTVTTYHIKVKEQDVRRSYDVIHQRLA